MRASAAFCLVVCLASACGDDLVDAPRLVLFHTNDEHSHLFGFPPEIDDYPAPTEPGDGAIHGGIVRRAALLASERAALGDDADSLLVSAGDQTQGALPQIAFTTESPDFRLMGALGYDVMCPGNHEFDLGPDAYAQAIEAAGDDIPQIVSSNIHFDADDDGDDELAALYGDAGSDARITPYHVVTTASGLRVGFFGIMGVSASFFAPLKTPVRFSADDPDDEGDREAVLPQLYDDIEPVVEALREVEEVDVVVALSHSGVDTETPELGDDYQIAANVPGIDLIVSGHSHTPLEAPVVVEGPDGHEVPIVQAGSFGRWLGRVELSVPDGERPSLADDAERTRLIPIDDTIVPEDQDLIAELDGVIERLEADVLPEQLSRVEGEEISDDDGELGELYFRTMGETEFDVIGTRNKVETNMLNLATDAMLAAAEDLVGPTDVAVQASGQVRDDIVVGRTGALSYADLYRVLPLGENPADGSAGYPLIRFYIYTAELKAALEVGVSRGYIDDSLYLSAAGIRVEYDTSRDPQVLESATDALDPENGRITKIMIDVDHSDGVDEPTVALFDLSRGELAWDSELGDAFNLISVVTTLYIASFADTAGVTLKDDSGTAIEIADAILRRPDDSDVKDVEAFIRYVRDVCADNDGLLPDRYDESSAAGEIPRRMLCEGPLCID